MARWRGNGVRVRSSRAAGDGVGDFDGAGFVVDLVPEDGEGFADLDAGSEHEGDEVGEIR